jgi:HEAT repeat protein
MDGREKAAQCRAILGVREGAAPADLKKAFRRKAVALHPDAHPGDPLAADAFKKVTAAYEYLKTLAREDRKKTKKETAITKAPKTGEQRPRSANAQKTGSLPIEELLIRLRHSDNPYVRLHAVRAIAAAGGKAASWAIIQALTDPDRKVVVEAVKSIAALRARIAVMPLAGLHGKADPALQMQIERALEAIDSPMARNFLLKTRKFIAFAAEEAASPNNFFHIA